MNVNYPGYFKPATEPVIVLPTCKGIMVIPVQQIIRIQSISNYSKLFFRDACPATGGGKTLVVAKVLHWFEERLSPLSTQWRGAGGEGFIRIHRSHFVNSSYIKKYCGGKNSLLFLCNGEILTVSKRKKTGLAERLNSFSNSFINRTALLSHFSTKKILAA